MPLVASAQQKSRKTFQRWQEQQGQQQGHVLLPYLAAKNSNLHWSCPTAEVSIPEQYSLREKAFR